MQPSIEQQNSGTFVERRGPRGERPGNLPERRQFRDASPDRSPEVAELADAIDEYKMNNRRRFITMEELYGVILELGYRKQ